MAKGIGIMMYRAVVDGMLMSYLIAASLCVSFFVLMHYVDSILKMKTFEEFLNRTYLIASILPFINLYLLIRMIHLLVKNNFVEVNFRYLIYLIQKGKGSNLYKASPKVTEVKVSKLRTGDFVLTASYRVGIITKLVPSMFSDTLPGNMEIFWVADRRKDDRIPDSNAIGQVVYIGKNGLSWTRKAYGH